METSAGGANVRFQPTAWSVVRAAQGGAREAWDDLITRNWKPVYFFIRRRGHDVEAAKDLAQGFFAMGLEKEFLDGVSADKGRFRSWLLGALKHFLSDQVDKARAKKRGGDRDFVRAEVELQAADPSPEKAFLAQWAKDTLARAMNRLRTRVPAEDVALLAGDGRSDLTPTDRKHRVFRLKQKLQDCLREELLAGVESPGDLDSEIRELFSALGAEC